MTYAYAYVDQMLRINEASLILGNIWVPMENICRNLELVAYLQYKTYDVCAL